MYNTRFIFKSISFFLFFLLSVLISQETKARSFLPEANACFHEVSADFVEKNNRLSAQGENPVLLEDLIGNPCYPSPNNLVVCGLGDTIPIMLYTKATDTIYDIILNVEFEEGLEYASFAYVDDPYGNNLADLDTVNVSNPESPVFRINELSQTQGGVVVYIGVRAVCGVDYSVYTPKVTYNLSYESGGNTCSDSFTPEVNYSSNILTPDLQFIGDPSPSTANFTGFNTNNCITTQVAGRNAGAGLVEAIFTISDYGYDFSDLFVNGEAVPASAISTDPMTGQITAYIDGVTNPNYWGADGQLTFNETIDIQACFQSDACTDEEYTPIFSVQSGCSGEVCGGTADFATGAKLQEGYTWNTSITRTFTNTTQPSFCDPTEPSPYTFELSVVSTNTNAVEGDLYNLLFFTDACPSSFLSLDTIHILDGPGGNIVGFIPKNQTKSISTTSTLGRVHIYFRNMDVGYDPDGPGGLEDLDGDGVFDDLSAGTPLYFRVEMLPSCSSELLACSTTGGGCDFTNFWWQGSRNCGINTFSFSTAIDDGIAEYNNQSSGQFENLETFNVYGNDHIGYNIENLYSDTSPQSEAVQFSYQLGTNDFASCPSGGPLRLQVQLLGPDTLTQDIELANIFFDGAPATILTDVLEEGKRLFVIDAGSAVAGTHTYNFDVVFDYQHCAPRQLLDFQALVIQDCDGCDCVLSKACDNVTLGADPANPSYSCTSGRNQIEIERITPGYTGRDLTNQLTPQDIANPDKTRLMPGDVVKLNGWIAVDNPIEWNNVDRSYNFQVIHLQNSSTASRTSLTSRLDLARARLQSFSLKRESTGENFDLAAINLPGDYSANSNNSSGIWVIGNRGNVDPTIQHPAITGNQYITGQWRNSSNDYADAAYLSVYFGLGEQVPNDQPAVQELFNTIGGAFQQNDTVFIEWTIPIISTPRFLADGSNTFQNLPLETGYFRFDVDGRSWTGSISNNLIGTINGDAAYEFYEPYIRSERRVELFDNGCRAEMTHTFSIANPPPADWYEDEFRPIIGIEDLEMQVPREYFTDGDLTVTHYDQPSQILQPDSIENLIPLEFNGEARYMSCAPRGTFFFVDAEKKDGLRADDYLGFDTGDNDVSLTGGTFPMLGVGLNPTGLLAADSLQFKIPLRRACNTNVDLSLLTSTYNASYPYLPDYDIPNYTCNQGQWYGLSGSGSSNNCTPNGLPSRYWPYDREDDGNPHHVANDSLGIFSVTGSPQINFTASNEAFSPSGPIVDLAGNETFNYELNLTNAIPEGILVLRADLAFDLISIDGNAPVYVNTTDSTNVYYYDLGARPSGPMSLPIVSNLNFCEQARLFIAPVLGCTDAPAEVAELVAAGSKNCNEISINYISGLPEIQTTFLVNPTTQLCAEEDYSIIFYNSGTSDFYDFFPTLFLPEGMEIDMGSFAYTLQGSPAATSIVDPTENSAKTGVNGVAFEWAPSTFPDIPVGLGLEISFRASTTCNSVLGKPIAALVNASVACNRAFDSEPLRSVPITVLDGTNPVPSFSFAENTFQITCGGNSEVLITAFNTGKAPADGGQVCLTLPPGINLQSSDITFIAPQDTLVRNFASAAVGTGGASQACFDAPPLSEGGFFCIKLNIDADLECGKTDIAFNVLRNASFICQTTGMECEVAVNDTPEQYITLEVNPPIAVNGSPSVTAACAAVGTFDLNYNVPVRNISGAAFNGNVDVEMYFDADGSGALEGGDPLVGTNTQNIALDSAGVINLVGTVNVPETQSCKLILRVSAAGCLCSEIIIPVEEVLPEFITDLGSDVILCPGDTYDLELGCGSPSYFFTPEGAGTATLMGTTLTLDLNPGFGINAPVRFTLESKVGACSGQTSEINITRLDNFTVADKDFSVCSAGCQQLDLGIDINLMEDIEVSFSPTTFLEDPTSPEPIICDPTSDISYTATFSLNGGQCTTSATFDVMVSDPPTIDVVPLTNDCRTLGFRLADLMTVMPGNRDAVWESRGDGYFDAGMNYYTAENYIPGAVDRDSGFVQLILKMLDSDTLGNAVTNPCGSVIQRLNVAVIPCFDFGDLPDNGSGTGTGNYETGSANSGPRHMLIPGLSIGATADFENDGQPDSSATGDGNDEDGFGFSTATDIIPGNTINIPLNITNTTDSIAYLVGWIDWNADGEFDASEQIVNLADDGTGNLGMSSVQVTVPPGVQIGSDLGIRFRLSNEDNLTPYGIARSGEVEDYLLRAGCGNGTCNFSVNLNVRN